VAILRDVRCDGRRGRVPQLHSESIVEESVTKRDTDIAMLWEKLAWEILQPGRALASLPEARDEEVAMQVVSSVTSCLMIADAAEPRVVKPDG